MLNQNSYQDNEPLGLTTLSMEYLGYAPVSPLLSSQSLTSMNSFGSYQTFSDIDYASSPIFFNLEAGQISPYFGSETPVLKNSFVMPSPISPAEEAYYGKTQNEDGSFPCTVDGCGKSFNRQFNLKSHLKTHNDERSFSCQFCESTFRRSHDLKRHIRSLHSTEKLFGCNNCGKKFSRTDALRRHASRPGSICARAGVPSHKFMEKIEEDGMTPLPDFLNEYSPDLSSTEWNPVM